MIGPLRIGADDFGLIFGIYAIIILKVALFADKLIRTRT
jgi:hypothetical protein